MMCFSYAHHEPISSNSYFKVLNQQRHSDIIIVMDMIFIEYGQQLQIFFVYFRKIIIAINSTRTSHRRGQSPQPPILPYHFLFYFFSIPCLSSSVTISLFCSLTFHWFLRYITIRFAYEHQVEFKWFWYSQYFNRTLKHFI